MMQKSMRSHFAYNYAWQTCTACSDATPRTVRRAHRTRRMPLHILSFTTVPTGVRMRTSCISQPHSVSVHCNDQRHTHRRSFSSSTSLALSYCVHNAQREPIYQFQFHVALQRVGMFLPTQRLLANDVI